MRFPRIRRSGDPVIRMVLTTSALLGCLLLALRAFHSVVWCFARGDEEIVRSALEPFLRIERALPIVACVIYGFVRAERFHPACKARYRQWLALTPWTPDKPLPLGPVALTWPDALFAVFATLCFYGTAGMAGDLMWILLPAGVLLTAYLVGALLWLFATGRREGLVVTWGLAVLFLPGVPFVWLSALVVGLYLLSYRAYRMSLPAFPWGLDDAKKPKAVGGWPLGFVGPSQGEPESRGARLLGRWRVAALAGWWIFCVLSRMNEEGALALPPTRENVLVICAAIGEFVALIRWVTYCGFYHSPISLWGRLRTGRLIIPGYDRVLVPIAIVAAVGIALPVFLYALGASVPLGAAVCACIIFGLAVSLPPSMIEWRTTGKYSVRPPSARELSARSNGGSSPTRGKAAAFAGQ